LFGKEPNVQPNPEYIKELQTIVAEAPFPKHMSMRLVEMDVGMATIELDLSMVHLQPFGLVHGGVIATIIDTATFWAVFMGIPEDAGLVNVDLKLNYLKSVTKGRLRAEGRSIREGKTICYSEARVYDELGSLTAHGTSTLMVLPGKGLRVRAKKFLPV
jgi:uncharacterized protein (TIGR00369 family)